MVGLGGRIVGFVRFGNDDDFGDQPGMVAKFEGATENGEEVGGSGSKAPFEEPVRDTGGARGGVIQGGAEGRGELLAGDREEGPGRERWEGKGGQGRGSVGEVEEPVLEDSHHDRGIGGDAAGGSGEGGDPGVVATMSPLHHVPDACVQVVEE